MRFLNKLGKTYSSILIAVVAGIISVTIILSAALYLSFEKISFDLINNANVRLLTQVGNNLDYINTSAFEFGMSIFQNIDSKNLLYIKTLPENDSDMISVVNSLSRINNSTSSVSYIHSIYLYNSTIERFFSTSLPSFESQSTFFDKEAVHLLKTNRSNLRLVARKIPSSLAENTPSYVNVYTYVYFDTIITGSARNDAVIINLKSDWLTKEISSLYEMNKLYDSKNSMVFIIDEKGIVINHPNEKMFLENMSDKPYIHKILTSKNNSGYFIDFVNKHKSIITFISPKSMPKWNVISITPYETITSQLGSIRSTTLLTLLTILIIGACIAYIITKRVYAPINQLVSNINHSVKAHDSMLPPTDELKFISDAFTESVRKSTVLENFKCQNLQLLRQELLKDIVITPVKDLIIIQTKFSDLGIPLVSTQPICIIIFKIDRYASFVEQHCDKDQSLMRFAIANIADELFSVHYACATVDMGSDHVLILLSQKQYLENKYNVSTDHINEITHHTQEECLKYLEISLTAATSSWAENITFIHRLYNEALSHSNYRLVFGLKSIITPDSVLPFTNTAYEYPLALQNQLIIELKHGHMMNVKNVFLKIASQIIHFAYSNIALSYIYLASNIFSTLNLIESNSTIRFEADYYLFNKEIINLETIEEINMKFDELFKYIDSKLNKPKNEKVDLLISNITDMISSNYENSTFCLDSVASDLKMSPVYIGKLFRDVHNCAIGEYINRVRLEKAKELLITTTYNVEEIAEKVGMINPKYLFKIFKKIYGVTPGEYRAKETMK